MLDVSTARAGSGSRVRRLGRGESLGLAALLVLSYAAVFVPPGLPGGAELLVGWIPVAFAFWHLARWAGPMAALVSFLVISVISFTAEAVGVATGWVFGAYAYADGPLGPLVLGVPPLILLEYFAMGYASYFLARTIAGSTRRSLTVGQVVAVAALAAFCITALDLASDPWKSTHLGLWVWRDGGAYFGVPLHNFVGWWAESFVFFTGVGFVLRGRAAATRIEHEPGTPFELYGVLLYGTFPLGVAVTPLLYGSTTIGDALVSVALFGVAPLFAAGLVSLRRSPSR